MKYLAIILIIISFAVLVLGMNVSSGAPQEAVVVAITCFLAILARIAQASGHQAELKSILKVKDEKSE